MQYYQYSADQGNADAASAIGQLFSVGVRGIDQARGRPDRWADGPAALPVSRLHEPFSNCSIL